MSGVWSIGKIMNNPPLTPPLFGRQVVEYVKRE